MKKLITLVLVLLFSTPLFAEPPKQVIFFGDSLTDNGNLYRSFLKKIPKSPPYYSGRFSNGPTWAEYFAQFYLTKYNASSVNYAVGGSTVILRRPKDGFLPYNLNMEVKKYLRTPSDKSKALIVIWTGANDYLSGQTNVEQATTDVVTEIKRIIETLIKAGGNHFIIFNLPDLASVPFASTIPDPANLHRLSISHNQKLDFAVKEIQKQFPNVNVSYVNIYELFTDLIQNPEKYNQKYHQHFKNIKESCWTGGYTLQKTELENELEKVAIEYRGLKNPNLLANITLQSPALLTAYETAKGYSLGATPCDKPDDYLFWDRVHPTAAVHKMLSDFLIETLITTRAMAF